MYYIVAKEMDQPVDDFLNKLSFTLDQFYESYKSWGHGGRGWNGFKQGGIGIMKAIMWYQHTYRPGSREWRPRIIIQAVVKEVKLLQKI